MEVLLRSHHRTSAPEPTWPAATVSDGEDHRNLPAALRVPGAGAASTILLRAQLSQEAWLHLTFSTNEFRFGMKQLFPFMEDVEEHRPDEAGGDDH